MLRQIFAPVNDKVTKDRTKYMMRSNTSAALSLLLLLERGNNER
jgi:hypothetical protein